MSVSLGLPGSLSQGSYALSLEAFVTCVSIITGVTTSIALLPGVGITSKICLLTATLADKDNPSSDALLSDNLSNSQETFVEGWKVRFQMAHRGIYSAHACSISKSHNENTNIKCNACDVMWLYRSLGGEVLIHCDTTSLTH